MPNYIRKALKLFGYRVQKEQHSPHPCAPIIYGAKVQYAKQAAKSPTVDAKTKKFIQQVCSKFLFLARAVDSTLLCPISAIASQAANPTEETLELIHHLLDYLGTQEEAVFTYNASNMVLAAHSNTSYLSKPNAKKQSRRTLLPFQQHHHTTKQRRHPKYSTYYTTHDVISNGSRISRSVHNGMRGSLHQNHIRRTQAQTTTNATTN